MNSPLKLTGVVLNEMKGYVFNNEFYKSIAAVDSLYKGAPGSFNGGGDPYVIPELTLEELLESHKKYYVPSNCLVILYGDIDTNEVLKFMDKEHLSLHDRKEQIQEYNISDNLSEKVYTNLKYPVPERENRNNKHIFINSFATGSINDVRESFAIKFLVSM
ncbi:Putative peptidase, partial [Candidatus Arthromitus sp. SFB-3]